MVDDYILRIRDVAGPKILEIFAVDAELPEVKFQKGMLGITGFAYTKRDGEEHIIVDPNYNEQSNGGVNLVWGMSEELSHFCHYKRNRDFFMRKIDLVENTNVQNNNELLEMDNFSEFIARMGGLAAGFISPPDFGRTMEAWLELTKSTKSKTKRGFDRYVREHPEYAKKLFSASARVWGTGIADSFAGIGGIKQNVPRYRKILRELTKCDTFDEAAEVFEKYMPDSKEAKELRFVKEKLFSMY